MRSTSAQYKRLAAEAGHIKEIKAVIAGIEYGQDDIMSCAVSSGLFSEVAVGQCIARELDLVVRPKGAIPRMAQISLFLRLVLDGEASEWAPKGVYYMDTRSVDEVTGLLTLHGYDAMLKAEQIFFPEGGPGEWPRGHRAVVDEICTRMGVSLDGRSDINSAYRAEYPNDLTMREVLGYVAAAHGGNWIMTDEGELLLAPLGGLPPETGFLVDSADGGAVLLGEVRILV